MGIEMEEKSQRASTFWDFLQIPLKKKMSFCKNVKRLTKQMNDMNPFKKMFVFEGVSGSNCECRFFALRDNERWSNTSLHPGNDKPYDANSQTQRRIIFGVSLTKRSIPNLLEKADISEFSYGP